MEHHICQHGRQPTVASDLDSQHELGWALKRDRIFSVVDVHLESDERRTQPSGRDANVKLWLKGEATHRSAECGPDERTHEPLSPHCGRRQHQRDCTGHAPTTFWVNNPQNQRRQSALLHHLVPIGSSNRPLVSPAACNSAPGQAGVSDCGDRRFHLSDCGETTGGFFVMITVGSQCPAAHSTIMVCPTTRRPRRGTPTVTPSHRMPFQRPAQNGSRPSDGCRRVGEA